MSAACCVTCRLIQAPVGTCVACGAKVISLDDDVSSLRHPSPNLDERGTPRAYARAAKWVGILFVWPVALVTMAARQAQQRRDKIAAIKLRPSALGNAARVYTGTAHPLGSSSDETLVEETVLYRGGAVLFRQVRAKPFVVHLDDGRKIVVDGEVRMLKLDAVSRTSVSADGSIFERLGIPRGLRVSASLGVSTLRDGARVIVEGEPSDEIRPELASYRDAGEVVVLRGRTGAVVAIATKG